MTTVTEAVLSRRSIRSFLDRPVDNELIKILLEKSSLSPSGGNLQPWQIYIINNESMSSFHKFQKEWSEAELPEYQIYPEKLKEPYRTSRYEVGEQIYSSIGIKREDKTSRVDQMLKNFDFFGAPTALFCFIDKQMNLPQWSDLGMFLQTFMLLAQESNLDTCAQESWSLKQKMVSAFVNADQDSMLFCGISIGYKDEEASINQFKRTRRPIDEWAKFI
tara:strand:+ start:30 stop:686 length:657 start_codon:yes stop_codon:yes gene_type:complete